ncbi:MAG: class I SAM-dependent DNA methyltransferase [Planctomycetota bacterium]|jgi:SAM-dependent methyltransferase
MGIYGKDFAALYDEGWAWFGPWVWPFLSRTVAKRSPNASAWLDLCCGAGSLLKLVCDAGFQAVGLDGSRHQLRHARGNAPSARLVRSDVRAYDLGGEFDVITCMFDSLNYLTTKKDLERAFRCARRHLAEGGVFVFDVNTFEGLRENWRRTAAIRAPGRLTVVESSFEEKRARGRCLITGFVKEGRLWRRFEEDHIQRGYLPEEVDGLLDRSGFALRKYDGRAFGRPRKRSGRLFYICWRG